MKDLDMRELMGHVVKTVEAEKGCELNRSEILDLLARLSAHLILATEDKSYTFDLNDLGTNFKEN